MLYLLFSTQFSKLSYYPVVSELTPDHLKSLPPLLILDDEKTRQEGFVKPTRYQITKLPAVFPGLIQFPFAHSDKKELEIKILQALPTRYHQAAQALVTPILMLAEKYELDPFWILSIIWTESDFKQNAISRVGALGFMQLMPKTQRYLIQLMRNKNIATLNSQLSDRDLEFMAQKKLTARQKAIYRWNIDNIERGVFYLKRLYRSFDRNPVLATVAYNMGPTWTRRQLNNKQQVGRKNLYLDKVAKHYHTISLNFFSYAKISYTK
jgi:soluble lytic murein transglycosylase